jgi:hypothetical protein
MLFLFFVGVLTVNCPQKLNLNKFKKLARAVAANVHNMVPLFTAKYTCMNDGSLVLSAVNPT